MLWEAGHAKNFYSTAQDVRNRVSTFTKLLRDAVAVASLQGCTLLSRSRHDMPGSQSLGCADRLRRGRPIHYQVETSPTGADAATVWWTYLWPRSRPVRWSEGKSPSQPQQRGENGSSRGPPVFGPLPRHILRKREWSVWIRLDVCCWSLPPRRTSRYCGDGVWASQASWGAHLAPVSKVLGHSRSRFPF